MSARTMHSRRTGLLRKTIALVATALLLAACGASASPSATTSASAPGLTLLPSADAYHSAIVATRALGTARITVAGSRPSGLEPKTLSAEGVSVLGAGMGDLTWTTPQGTYREIANNRGIYGTANGVDWTQWAVDDPTSTSGFVDPLRGLGVLNEATLAAHENLGTVATTRYTGWLPLDAKESRLLGLDPATASALGPDAREQITVWIDDFGHAVRVDRTVPDASGTPLLTTSTNMTEFSLQLDLSSPSSNVTLAATPLP